MTNSIGSEETVVVPSSVKEILYNAFKGSTLKRVYIPGSVKKIGSLAFANCSLLEEVNIADGVLSFDAGVFENDTALKKVRLPVTLSEYGTNIFRGCTYLESIILPDSYNKISFGWLSGSGIKEITIGRSIREIESCAFEDCNQLTSIEIPGSVNTLGSEAFARCSALAEIKLNEGLKLIEGSVFRNCPVKEITLPRSVNTMYYNVFDGFYSQIFVHKGSYAERYMIENGLEYETVD